MKKPLNIVFLGTAEFAVASLDILLKNGYYISAVVTVPDKPSGRGLQVNQSPVYTYAKKNRLRILQPENIKSPEFISELLHINPDLQIVVAFRMLPEIVWKMPRLGTFNLHASLLPQYRGAAPINRAIMNGESKTGVTTFFINENIDTGNIIMQEEIAIDPFETAGELHDKLKFSGANLVLKTVAAIRDGNLNISDQKSLISADTVLKTAPKIFKEDCQIQWNSNSSDIFNHIRGLSPYPAAFTEIISPEGNTWHMKIFKCSRRIEEHQVKAGRIITDGKSLLSVAVPDGFIDLEEIQLQSKKKMATELFLRGFPMNNEWSARIV